MASTTTVIELVQRWQELHDKGQSVSAEELCAESPELLDKLRQQIQAFLSMEQFLDSADDARDASSDGISGPASSAETTGSRPGETSATVTSGAPLVASRYRPLRLHAQGGLGEVYLARDEELSREVALKCMQWKYASDGGSRRRFVREGEITGGLEHPGVVPVYGLGSDADGHPCYAMRFIRGETLQDAITRFHSLQSGGFHSLSFRNLLVRFVVVCNTIAYAHSRGVIHRDLKPANIMLGDYGETLVVDWGLARRIDMTGEAQRPNCDDVPNDHAEFPGDRTGTGDVVGTPAFMSPEQAAGRHDAVGPASDIYGLGATLYSLLTGRPPFAGDGVLQKVERGDFPQPRQPRPDSPRALEAICLKAMAREPAARYKTALELAADLERWLADEPVSAYPEPVWLRLGRWARRHRAALRAAVIVGLILGVLGGLGAWWLDRQQTESRRGVEGAIAEVGMLQRQAKWALAGAVLNQAQDRLGKHGPSDLQRTLTQMRSDLDLVARLDAVTLARATIVGGKLDDAGADRGYALVFAAAGLGTPAEAPQTVAERVRGSAVLVPLVAAMDDWADCAQDEARRTWLLTVAQHADPDPWRDRARDATHWRDSPALKRLAQEDAAVQQPQLLVASVARRLGKEGLGLLRRAQALHPDDFWLTFRLGLALQPVDPTEAAGFYRAALALRPDTPAVLNNLGNILFDQGRVEDARVMYLRACALNNDLAPIHTGLGNVLHRLQNLNEAAAEFRAALAIDPHFAAAHNGLGAVLHDQGNLNEAEKEYRLACDIDSKLAQFRHNLGNVLFDQRQLKEAETEFRRACDLDPRLALPHFNLGVVLGMQNRLEEAKAEFVCVCNLDSKNAAAHNFLGRIYLEQGRLDEAEKAFRRACELNSKFAAPKNGLGKVLRAKDRRKEAKAEFRRAVELQPAFADAHVQLGQLLQEEGQLDEALAAYRRAYKSGGSAFSPPLRACEVLLALRKRLPGLASGQDRPIDQRERLAFADLCRISTERRYALAARLYSEALVADPKLAACRYSAACAAALAGCGQGDDGRTLTDQQTAWFRKQALAWLTGELEQWSQRAKSDKPAERALVHRTLERWQKDADLARVRQPEALAKLPEAEWRSWLTLWANVDAARQRAERAKEVQRKR
jgi:serine/threonine-protein kinase